VAYRKNIRKITVKSLKKVFEGKRPIGYVVDKVLSTNKDLDGKDRDLFTFLVYGTYKRVITIDWILRNIYGKKLYLDNELKAIIYLGVFEIFYSNIPEYATINELVEIAKRFISKKAGNFVNFILRRVIENGFPELPSDEIERASILYSHPTWLVRRWKKEVGDDYVKVLEANLKKKDIHLRLNSLKGINNCKMKLFEEDIKFKDSPYLSSSVRVEEGFDIFRSLAFKEGYVTVQDEASQLISHIVDPRKNEKILDTFAGRGNKTTHLLELSGNGAIVFSLDKNRNKLKDLKENVKRLSLKMPEIINEKLENFKVDFKFDKILFDAPCTGLGTVRRKPEILSRIRKEDIKRSASNIMRLLNIVKNMVRIGGSIIYSVCSFEKEEGEDIIKSFLSKNRNFDMDNISIYLPEKAKIFIRKKFFYTIPGVDDVDGFFASRLIRLC